MIATARNFLKTTVAGALMLAFFGPVMAQTTIPGEVQDTCTVSGTTFNSWFDSGSVSLNGTVKGADSLSIPKPISACSFYQWGAQMFLWMTSPEDGRVALDGSGFFTVSPVDGDGNRHLIENTSNSGATTAVRSQKGDDIGELRQAGGGGVLMSQGKSLVYYGIHVNDVYGYFLTGQKAGSFPDATTYPRNSADMDALSTYMKTAYPDVSLDDPVTLVMELKTSWVDATTVADPDQYVTIAADVPGFTSNADNTTWTPTGDTEKMRLALVGMHIVGTVENHPEFVWATFEHVSNAPDASYWYKNSKGDRTSQPYDSTGSFLFMQSGGGQAGANVACMKQTGDGSIVANLNSAKSAPLCDGGIVPSNTFRAFPWGNPANGESDAIIENNTLLLSVNNSVIEQLSDGDVRRNYLQIGSSWTAPQSGATDAPVPAQGDHFSFFDLRGSLTLSNATMETYHQGSTCFDCHQLAADAKTSFEPFQLLHIYSQILPLPKSGN